MQHIKWENGCLVLLDQTLLPSEKREILCRTYHDVAEAIVKMRIRGAPAIGVVAAYGIVLAAQGYGQGDSNGLIKTLDEAKELLASTRPTAVNLFWALERMEQAWLSNQAQGKEETVRLLEEEAIKIEEEDLAQNIEIGRYGNTLVPPKAAILTHCNAGALATAGYGTALGVIRYAHQDGKEIMVYADETRPVLQGARLTAWELTEEKIPVTLITDNTAGYLMQQGKIDLVIVGADRIAANGDVANKIGTYSLAIMAYHHHIPFYVAAPLSTFDRKLSEGKAIPIEERNPDEVRMVNGVLLAPENIKVYNAAFDVTPAQYITAIITDEGLLKPPYQTAIADAFRKREGRS